MHGKAQLELAQHSIVLDCKLVPLHNTCHAVRLAVSSNAKTRQPFSAVAGPKFRKFGGRGQEGSACRSTSFFPIVDIMFLCRYMLAQSSKSFPKIWFFCPSPWGL